MTCKNISVAIIGAGPAGCMCASVAAKFDNLKITLFDNKPTLHTLLYTGGGRCNLAYAEYDFRELAKFYPRGEKFLYSVFSRFSTSDTVDFFNSIDVQTYVQDDSRIFPTSNSAKDVREKFLEQLKNCNFVKEKVVKIFPSCLDLNEDSAKFEVVTENNKYYFDKVVITTGGHAGFSLAQDLGHNIIEPKPSLTGLITKENFKSLQGLSLKNLTGQIFWHNKKFACKTEDLLFTHEGISGPLAYKISSICARLSYDKENPLIINLNLINRDIDLQSMFNSNPKKDIRNLIAELIPKSLSEYILFQIGIDAETKCCNINGKTRDLIFKTLTNLEINVISPAKEGEIVTSGGVCLNEIDARTMESKLVDGLYFCGEVIDVDGFCGGFNLQNCWSTGFIVGNSLEQ